MDFIRSTLNSLPLPPPPLNMLEDNIGGRLLVEELDHLGLFDGAGEMNGNGNNNGGDTSPTEQPPLAPPETQWYHGRLDRHTTDDRLVATGKPGSYLVRESDRKPGSYVLSYLGRTGINHFRITAVCGDFYIGGRRFDSLMDMIGYYTSVSDLLKKERLMYPIPPPEPVNDKKRIMAILPYTRMPDTDELSFQKGDIFFVHNDLGDGWLWATAHRTGEQGLIFRDLVEDLDDTIDPNSVFPWFHSNVTKDEAVNMLVAAGPGSFLVRPSDNSPGDYSLFFHINNQIQRFRIEKKGVRYLMGGRTFDCLDAVINRYKTEQIVEGHTLGHHVSKVEDEMDMSFKSPEVKNPEKIYATLQECRDTSGIKKTEVCKKSGYLYKRNEKNKKWKSMFFVLQMDGTDTHLLIFDSPKRTKPKGLVDLGCAYLYPLHDSFFEKPFCFQLVERALPCLATVTYLCASSLEELQGWTGVLKPLCVPQMARAPKIPRLRELRCLNLSILEAHRLPYKLVPNPMCILSLNNVKVARTKVKSGYDPVWDEEFLLDDISPDVITFTISVLNKGKRAKDSEVAEITIDLSALPNGEEKEEWYSLSGITPVGDWGSLRLKIRYMNDLIMPVEEYSPLKELLLDAKMETVKALADACHSNRSILASSLLRVFQYEKKETDLLASLVEQTIFREGETTTLFRADSLTTTLMDSYMKSICQDFLIAAVSDTINRILESKLSCELNPAKMEPGGDNCANAEFLLVVLDEITENIFMAYDSCPESLRYICGCLQRAAMSKWPNERLVKTRVVSGFIFLRLICPSLLNPRQFGLVSETPPQMATRSLIMIAKCLQNLANLVEFGGKEPYMEVVNPFILKNKERMIVFLDHLSNVKEKPETTEELQKLQIDPARDMGSLHHTCVTNFKELQSMSRTQPTIKKLVTVTEMLSKHKQKYREMLRA